MSNPTLFLAPPHCPSSTAVEEPSNHAPFQDIVENQNLPGVSSPKGLDSNTEVQHPPTQTQSQDDSSHQNDNEATNMPPAPRRSTRNRSPSLQKPQLYTKRWSGPYNVNSWSSKPKNTSLNLMKICTPQTLGLDTGNCACENKRSF